MLNFCRRARETIRQKKDKRANKKKDASQEARMRDRPNAYDELLSSPIGGASISYFKNFCPRPRVIWFFRTITLESLNQSEPNFHT